MAPRDDRSTARFPGRSLRVAFHRHEPSILWNRSIRPCSTCAPSVTSGSPSSARSAHAGSSLIAHDAAIAGGKASAGGGGPGVAARSRVAASTNTTHSARRVRLHTGCSLRRGNIPIDSEEFLPLKSSLVCFIATQLPSTDEQDFVGDTRHFV